MCGAPQRSRRISITPSSPERRIALRRVAGAGTSCHHNPAAVVAARPANQADASPTFRRSRPRRQLGRLQAPLRFELFEMRLHGHRRRGFQDPRYVVPGGVKQLARALPSVERLGQPRLALLPVRDVFVDLGRGSVIGGPCPERAATRRGREPCGASPCSPGASRCGPPAARCSTLAKDQVPAEADVPVHEHEVVRCMPV